MATRYKKKQLINSQSRNNVEDVGEDRISKLPDPLIHHVLSFLPIKYVVSTTVLSKTWNNLWLSLPALDFREWRYTRRVWGTDEDASKLKKDTNRFMDFMDKTLRSDKVCTVKKFGLSVNTKYFDECRVREWIVALIKHNIQVFAFTLYVDSPTSKLIPRDLFTCESLTMLNFRSLDLHQNVLDFPQSISLPKLKVLRLEWVVFKDIASAQQLFSNCPILEELVLESCRQKKLGIISFSAPRLKFFLFDGILKDRYSPYHNLRVEIDAPNLVSMEYRGSLPEDFLAGTFPSLVEADFCYLFYKETPTGESLSEFIRRYSNIKLLKASSKYFQIFDVAKVPSTSFPTFNNLMRLEVYYDSSSFFPRFITFMTSLFKFLHFSPNLESLVIQQRLLVDVPHKHQLCEPTLNATPHCLLLCLKSIEFQNFKGFPDEMELARLFLKHAQALEMVIVKSVIPQTCSPEVILRFQNFPRASSDCSFRFP